MEMVENLSVNWRKSEDLCFLIVGNRFTVGHEKAE